MAKSKMPAGVQNLPLPLQHSFGAPAQKRQAPPGPGNNMKWIPGTDISGPKRVPAYSFYMDSPTGQEFTPRAGRITKPDFSTYYSPAQVLNTPRGPVNTPMQQGYHNVWKNKGKLFFQQMPLPQDNPNATGDIEMQLPVNNPFKMRPAVQGGVQYVDPSKKRPVRRLV
jgi:hypothetical protein